MPSLIEQSLNLFQFLHDLSALHTKRIKRVDAYEEVLFWSEIPKLPGCKCVAWQAADGLEPDPNEPTGPWMEVHKPHLTSPPELPDELEPWIKEGEFRDSSLMEPGIFEEILVSALGNGENENGELTETLRLDENEDIFEAYIDYVDSLWKPWAEVDRRLQSVQQVYNRLFAVFQLADKLGEQYETIVGIGHLVWRSPHSQDIRHPILMMKVRLEFDRTHGIIQVVPSIDGPEPRFEIDFLETDDRPTANDFDGLNTMLLELEELPWSPSGIRSLMCAFINSVSTDGKYEDTLSRPEGIFESPVLNLCPTLILRKRTRRTYVDFYQRIIEQLAEADSVPESVRRLVEIVEADSENLDTKRDDSSTDWSVEDREIYFPFPANEEQRQIATRIDNNYGILVQGPPGTGKSHTIRNLICHFLARGQSVLVTSETPRALKVIQDRLPEGLQELCVTWLGSGKDAGLSLERSVNTITQKQTSWSVDDSWRRVSQFQRQLEELRKRQAVLQTDLVALREKETYTHERIAGSYSGTLTDIAKQLDMERERLGWILDQPDSEIQLKLSASDLLFFLERHRFQSSDGYPKQTLELIGKEHLLDAGEFSRIVLEEEQQLSRVEKLEEARKYQGYGELASVEVGVLDELVVLINGILDKQAVLENHVQRWAAGAGRDCAADQDRPWRILLETTEEHISQLEENIRPVARIRVQGIEGRDLRELAHDAKVLKSHFDSGGRLGFGPFRPGVVKPRLYLVQKVKIDGRPCGSSDALSDLLEWLDANLRIRELSELWVRYAEVQQSDLGIQLATYADFCEPLREALAIHHDMERASMLVRSVSGLKMPLWHASSDIEALRDAIHAVSVGLKLQRVKAGLEPVEGKLVEAAAKDDIHPIVNSLLDAIGQRDVVAYRKLLNELKELHSDRLDYQRYCCVHAVLADVFPKTLDDILGNYQDSAWEGRLSDIEDAWAWNQADQWLSEMLDPQRMQLALQGLQAAKEQELRCLADLAVELAWQRCMSRLGERERQALIAWSQAVARIRRGTGRHAETHRQTARAKLSECRVAVPAWVMPLYQVVQTVEPGPGIFDVVIVDEASQSGPDALLLNYIGKRIIVVGDDKQIRPQHVGINRDNVTYLQQQHLRDIPHADSYGLESSLYSMAELRFANRIRLREHFRCMPEIIEFSNQLSYQAEPLEPLRQFGATRLEPVKVVHVPEGYREGQGDKVVNLPEVQRLVKHVVDCSAEAEYEDKSFGVIVLMGRAQAAEISKMLLSELGSDEFEKRNLLCGTPYDFQGDERDVIFLSMVDAPKDGGFCRMDRKEETQRKFNVAVSRAKDQLWLFHTPTLNNLRADCLRYQLLNYCSNPRMQALEMEGIDLPTLKEAASSSRRSQQPLPSPFDSWFEIDVFLEIIARGFRVCPQLEVAGFRIDLVIIGMEGRFAVECDGDPYHGPDQYLSDLKRQTELERSGWTFFRVSSSVFYRDRVSALSELWKVLESKGVFPESQWKQDSEAPDSTVVPVLEIPTPHLRKELEETPTGSQESLFGESEFKTPSGSDDQANEGRKRAAGFSPTEFQGAIVSALKECPNQSCTRKSLTGRVLRVFGILTRGNPRLEFESRVLRNVNALERKGVVEEYRAKNHRVRLLI
jgi:very-short-patch-repair endonuclease